mgnify:CR=1 FL=1
MTPRQFLSTYKYDPRLVTGKFFSSEPLQVERGDRVGVGSADVAPWSAGHNPHDAVDRAIAQA